MIRVVAGIIVDNGKILIARRAAHKSLPGKWEFPGGKVHPDEDPKTALERELREEFTIDTRTGSYLMTSTHRYAHVQIELLAFYSTHIGGTFVLSDHDLVLWLPATELSKYDFAEADIPIVQRLMGHYT